MGFFRTPYPADWYKSQKDHILMKSKHLLKWTLVRTPAELGRGRGCHDNRQVRWYLGNHACSGKKVLQNYPKKKKGLTGHAHTVSHSLPNEITHTSGIIHISDNTYLYRQVYL